MAGFIRRFGYFPTQQVISQIEGVVIVDTPPPQSIQGVNTGTVGLVGEFSDMTYATSIDGSGNVSTKIRPVEVFTAQDMLNKVGGFDSTLGDFGDDDGNGYCAVDGRIFSRLVIAPVNLASDKAVRMYRELPTNQSLTLAVSDPPMQAATIVAGSEFTSGSNRVHVAKTVGFTADAPRIAVIDAVSVLGASAATQVITSATAAFIAQGCKEGDAVVFGVKGLVGSGDAGCYRIVSVDSATQITVQALDGANFAFAGTTAQPLRIHPAATFDTGGEHQLSEDAGCTLPARPLDATISDNTILSSTNPAAGIAVTQGNANPLSGLKLTTQCGALTYTAAVQGVNAASSASMDAVYKSAIDAFLEDAAPTRDVSIIFAARTSASIRQYLYQHVQTSSATGRGRVAVIAPGLDTQSLDTAISATSPGVGATRDERVVYCWPGVQVQVQQAVGTNLERANGAFTSDGIIDQRADSFMASILSNLASEKNPGQATAPIPSCLAAILGFQSGNLSSFKMADYIALRQYGVAALRFDRGGVKVFQSGITSSLVAGQKNINRRRMADEIQDSLAEAYLPLSKQVLTQQLKDNIVAQTVAYLTGLKSPTNPSAQRIEDFSVDPVSGNTAELLAAGIFVVIARVKMLATADDIVLQSEVGPTVNVVVQ